jgi:signal transduction histidine kinase
MPINCMPNKQTAEVDAPESRVFICCPLGRDTELICGVLRNRDISCIPAKEGAELAAEIASGLSALVLSEEFFRNPAAREALGKFIATEPEWSDLPVIALLTPEGSRELFRRYNGELASLNLTVIERPARSETIAHAVMSALRARQRQYQVRDFLAERIKAEENLRRTQKLESIGVLAGGVAHDFNNLLTGILGNASLAYDILNPENPARDLVGDVISASEKAAHLTRQLLAYAGKGLFVIEPLDLSPLVRDISNLIHTSISHGVGIGFDLADNLPPIMGDAGQIQQVVMNLVINAAESIPPGERGMVMVLTRLERVEAATIPSRFSPEDPISPGLHVCLEVLDNGIGMTREIQERIFDPFFTTKFTGRGLGLAAVVGIVRGHKGALEVSSEPGHGSTFRVFFPAAVGAKLPRRKSAPAFVNTGRTTLVLVVDDEEMVRRTADTALRRAGHSVLTAVDGFEALKVFRKNVEDIGLVLLDLTMPGIDGEQTLHELRRIRQDVKVILSSGYNEAEVVERFSGRGLAGFVQKPYTAAELINTVSTVL